MTATTSIALCDALGDRTWRRNRLRRALSDDYGAPKSELGSAEALDGAHGMSLLRVV
jgi:hypothetical protein